MIRGIKKSMNKIYKKLVIRNKETEEIDLSDIKDLENFDDIRFRLDLEIGESHAIVFSFFDNALKYKAAKLSKGADWIIREYEGELYLIALKKNR